MPFIHLTTFIAAPVERVFDLSRSVDLHKASMKEWEEKPIAGKLNGLMQKGDGVTWRAKHLFKERQLSVAVTAMQKPFSFVDEQVKGDFEMMKHEHYFKPCDNGTIMIDHFYFEIRYGILGKWINRFYLEKYMKRLLEQRNATIKKAAESELWKHYLTIA